MYRTRDKSWRQPVFSNHVVWRLCSTGVQTSEVYADQEGEWHVQRITDEILPKSDKRTRNCLHHNVKFWGGPYSFIFTGKNAATTYITSTNGGLSSSNTSFSDIIKPWKNNPFLDDMDAFNARAYEAMKPSLEGNVSLTNFLLELGDIKHLLRFFAPSSDLFKKISEGHLNWSFGIKPLISDLSEIYNSLYNYEKRIKDFMDRRNVPQKHYYRESEDLADDAIQWTIGSIADKGIYRDKFTVTRVATMSYTYDCEDITSIRDRLKALRGILGLKFTPSVVWEAIPFSFVVDWFVNVGRFLESRENDVIEPDVFISDYSLSAKIEFSESIWYRYCTQCTSTTYEHKRATLEGTLYSRKRAIPNTSGVPLTLSLLSSNQLALAASLFNVRRR